MFVWAVIGKRATAGIAGWLLDAPAAVR